MTQRERLASGGTTQAAPALSPARPAPAAPTQASDPGAGVPGWEELFRRISPAQQNELLNLAKRQGLLYAHQLPSAGNGAPTEPARLFVGKVLGGRIDDLEPLRVSPVAGFDPALDAAQRDAVARALQTPDICLIRGLPGTGKSRVAAEIVAQAAARGERVLLLAQTPAAVDRVLEQVGTRDEVLAVRCLDRDEVVGALLPPIRALTYAERIRCLCEQSHASARADVETGRERSLRLRQDEPGLLQLREFAAQLGQGEERLRVYLERLGRIASEVEDEAAGKTGQRSDVGTFAADMAIWEEGQRDSLARTDSLLAEVHGKRDERRHELSGLDGEMEALRPVIEAKRHGRWWAGDWWRATLHPESAGRWNELMSRRAQLEEDLAALDAQSKGLIEDKELAERTNRNKRVLRVEGEAARRRAELEGQAAVLNQELSVYHQKWDRLCGELGPDTPRPIAQTTAATDEARAAWRAGLERVEAETTFAGQWASQLQKQPPNLAGHLARYVNVVAATTSSLANDPYFGDHLQSVSSVPVVFDVLVLEEADRITESEFQQLARRARRWVLVGDVQSQRESASSPVPPRPRSDDPRRPESVRPARPASLRPGFFQNLWQHLHLGPVWIREEGRLCCRLRPVSADERVRLESERVADRPDVELRISAAAHGRSALAEVVFPAGTMIESAKRYIFEQLEQLPIRMAVASPRWLEEPDRLILRLADQHITDETPVILEPGVRAMIGSAGLSAHGNGLAGWETCCVEFERGAGWHLHRAEEWVRRHLEVRDPGRTVTLDVPHRSCPELSKVLSDILFDGAYRLPGEAGKPSGSSFEFVPVPAPDGGRRGTRGEQGRDRTEASGRSKGGAGLELDLADARHRDRLPAELRPSLPARGLVNYLEAQAVVRKLAALAEDPHLRRGEGRKSRPAVAVLALTSAQAHLIRHLARQAPYLAASGLDYQVDVPAAFHQRESEVVLLSLTRSHTHRAVSYGDGPHAFTQALTRARGRLILFGDLGTLARRSHWEGPLDHLDEAASAREREIITGLVQAVQSQVRPGRALQLCEGKGL